MLDGLELIADVGRGWADVLLEQVIYIHRRDGNTKRYSNLKRDGNEFRHVGRVDKRECQRFGMLLNGNSKSELRIAHQMQVRGHFLGERVKVSSGGDLQKYTTGLLSEHVVIGGGNVQRYHLREFRGYSNLGRVPEKATIEAGNILVQDILAFIERPMKHIKITAHLVHEADSNFLILNTINRIVITDGLSSHFVLALLNCRLVNWYVYRFIFAKPIRTMHFNRHIISRIPLPNLTDRRELVEGIIAEVKSIYANRHANEKSSQERIDQYIYELYGLSPDQIALVEANMP